jgi:acid stress-induced BolA-like protein IbaG/YrbA
MVSFLRHLISITIAYSHFIVLVIDQRFRLRFESPDEAPDGRPQNWNKTMDAPRIQAMIEQGLPGAKANVRGDDGVHFEAEVVAVQFAGKLPLARHRLVYATLGDLMGGAIHALGLKTLTPDEAAARR